MDEGGIYEEGSPEQIFDHPQREKTIRFIRRIKVLEREIRSRDFDFIGFISALEEFGRKNQLSQKSIYRTQSAFEELCMQILLPALGDSFALHIAVSYSQSEDRVTLQFRCSGEAFDPTASDNALSLALARNAAESIEHSEIHDGEYSICDRLDGLSERKDR